jgi:predicted NBD/HSP70 family sugar kinase
MVKISGNPAIMKKVNKNFIKETLKEFPKSTKPQLAHRVGLSLATVNKVVEELVESGEARCLGYIDSTGGRRAQCYKLNENFELILTVFIQAGRYYCAALNMDGKIISSTARQHEGDDWTQELYGVIDKGLADCGGQKVASIGVAVPGSVHGDEITNIPSIPQWEGFALKTNLERRYGLTVVVENDINAATLGVHDKYTDTGAKNMLFLHIKQGIGAGVMINDRLYKGRHNFAGELAYMRLASGARGETLEDTLHRLHQNREAVVELVAELLANVICVIEPDLVAIDTCYLSEQDVGQLKQVLAGYISPEYLPEIFIRPVQDSIYIRGLFVLCVCKTQNSVELYQ